jgi:xylulose-5-phosphate/fructose-6-phosphate phosphoketolase
MARDEEAIMANALSDKERTLMDAYWRAANYLSVGQIYLYDNPLLKQSLTKEHIKPRLLGHWGTTPGLNFIYVHLNRLIKKHDLDSVLQALPLRWLRRFTPSMSLVMSTFRSRKGTR